MGPAQGEIVKLAISKCNNNSICFYWWPKLPDLKGWKSDQSLNTQIGGNGSNVLIPEGKTFSNAPAIIYARAIYAKRYDEEFKIKSTLASFIADDQDTFRKKGTKITEAAPITTADGQKLQVFTYSRPNNWETVSYGEEDGNYLLFVISAQSENGHEQALPIYRDLISHYKK